MSEKMGPRNVKEHKCIFCYKPYGSSEGLFYHYLVHTGERPFHCKLCDAAFRGNIDLKRHMSIHEDNTSSQWNKYCREKKIMQCNLCEKNIVGPAALAKHIRSHTGERPYRCDVCQKQFKRNGTLKIHQQTHDPHPVKSFKCDICDASFVRNDVLKGHMVVHAKVKPYQCDICGKSYSQLSGLGIHQKTVHQLVKNHECQLCGKRFGMKETLIIHMRIHTGERPFKCVKCLESFAHRSTLKNHQRSH